MTARKYKGAWWVDFRFERERIRKKSPVDTKRGAEEYERVLRNQLVGEMSPGKEANEKKPSENAGTFFEEWLETYALTENKPSEYNAKCTIVRKYLTPFFGKLMLDQIDEEQIARFKAAQIKKGRKAKTVNNYLTVLRKALVTAKEWKRLQAVPVVKWLETEPPTFDFLTREESDRLLSAVPKEDLAIVAVALKAGLRRGELLALEWGDVDFTNAKIYVRRSAWRGKVTRPKGGRHREVEMSPKLQEILKAHRHLKGKLVFSNPDGSMMTRDEIKRIIPTACKKAGLRPLRWHALRHSFASQLTMDGVPLRVVQELLGHATIEMTMRYAHLAPSARRDAIATLDLPAKVGHQRGGCGVSRRNQ
jgi:integrase